MESSNLLRPLLALLVGIGLIVLVAVLLIKAFSGGASAPSSQIDVTKYADSASSATLLVDAPTNLDQDHNQVKITVSGTENEINILKGYQGTVSQSKTYTNNTAAYAAFLQTLKLMNFSKGETSNIDYRGYCPTGDRYLLTFNDGNKDLFTYWATSCGGQGTYKGELGPVLVQFRNQINENDFDNLTSNIPLNF